MNGLPELPDGIELKDVPGYEGIYAVTNDGRVWSYPREWTVGLGRMVGHNGKWLKGGKKTDGNRMVTLRCDGSVLMYGVHVLVAMTYLKNPLNKKCVYHIDGNLENNNPSNLFWCDKNIYPSRITGTGKRRLRKVVQYTKNYVLLDVHDSIIGASRKTKIVASSISMVAQNKMKSAGGYVWRYAD